MTEINDTRKAESKKKKSQKCVPKHAWHQLYDISVQQLPIMEPQTPHQFLEQLHLNAWSLHEKNCK